MYLLISEPVLKGQGSLGDVSKNKRAGGHHFSTTPAPSSDNLPLGVISLNTLYLSTYLLAQAQPTHYSSCPDMPAHGPAGTSTTLK